MAPEIYFGHYTMKADQFAFGVILMDIFYNMDFYGQEFDALSIEK